MSVALCCAIAAQAYAETESVSFFKDIAPILRANCVGCHRQDKAKGKLDLSTFDALMKGGEEGDDIVTGKPDESLLVKQITGPEPEMPAKGEPLSTQQVALIARWIAQGAKNDTPTEKNGDDQPLTPPVYQTPPVIAAMAYSPDGKLLALGGYHEILLHKADGSALVGRLVGEAPRIEALAFSPDGEHLAACGGAPGLFGQVQVWNVKSHKLEHAYRVGKDSLYGLSLSPDGQTLAVGGAEKIVRQIRISDGKQLLDFRAHADWVRATAFTADGKQLVSAGRDKAMKLIDLATGRFVDDINNPLEPIVCLARDPARKMIAYGGAQGTARIYNISDNQKRTAGRNDTNLFKAFERLSSPITAVCFSTDGKQLAVGADGEARVYDVDSGNRLFILSGFEGPVYAIRYSPDGQTIAAAGYDGIVHLFNAEHGESVRSFVPAPIQRKPDSLKAALRR